MAFTDDLGESALQHNTRDFRDPRGKDLLARTQPFFSWQATRQGAGLWPYSRALEEAPTSNAAVEDAAGTRYGGVNFASQDYLSLSSTERLRTAAIDAMMAYGVHSAGSGAVVGNTRLSLQLERDLADFLKSEHVTLYPTGWAAGYGAIKGLVRPDDYVLLDTLAHSCLQEGAYASTRKVSQYRHLDVGHVRTLLGRIRKGDVENSILVVTEGLFSMDADSPDIPALQELSDEYNATLLVDVAHDLGSMGPMGTGHLGTQKMLGKVDLVMGSFSKTFGSNGGFVASRHASVKQFLKVFSPSQTFSNALSPPQTAIILEALKVVRSQEGDALRSALMTNILRLRSALQGHGLSVMGEPAPIVPVLIGREDHARLASRILPSKGVITNLAEFPAVPQNVARFRMQVMAGHTAAQAETAAAGVAAAIRDAAAARP